MRRFTEELRKNAREEARVRPRLRYTPHLDQLPRHLAERFEQATCDAATRNFLAQAAQGSVPRLLAAELLRCCCGRFVSRTAANGLLHRGGMFVLSTQQARWLLRRRDDDDGHGDDDTNKTTTMTSTSTSAPLYDTLLDVGAGDGGVTAQLAPLFAHVTVTEASAVMRWRLRRRGFAVRAVDDDEKESSSSSSPSAATSWWWWPSSWSTSAWWWWPRGEQQTRQGHEWQQASTSASDARPPPPLPCYDVVSCLNVLDRADAPLTLLRRVHASLRPGGVLLLAVVLPWCPFVECGAVQRAPREVLPMDGAECKGGATYEASLTALVQRVLQPCGFDVVRWTMLPYLCEGNMQSEYCVLHDAVLVLRRRNDKEASM